MASELIERVMYGGKYKLIHNPNARGSAPRYIVEDLESKELSKPKGVTTIMGQTLAKDLMGWALDCMEGYLKDKLPVVTEQDLKDAKGEAGRRRDSGAGTGTEAHALVEHYLKGVDVDLSDTSTEAQNAYEAFVKWFEAHDVTILNVEEVIYSETYKFAGTYDCMLKVDGKTYLCDLKTTNPSRKAPKGVYAENFAQLGAYASAHEEQRLFEEAMGGTNLVPIEDLMVISAKKNGKLDIVTASDVGLDVQECGDLFNSVVKLYRFNTNTTQRLGGK